MDTKTHLERHRFVLTPRPLKHLAEYVVNVSWNAVAKILRVQIRETPQFDVYEWMQYIKKQQAEIQKGPFVDLDKDAVTLQFITADGLEIANIKFKNISLVDHSCSLSHEIFEIEDNSLTHFLTLGYQEVEVIRKKEDDVAPCAANTMVDKEWQTEQT